MKELGILGGMGPLATATFFTRVVNNTKASTDQDHIKTIIISDTDIPDRTTIIMEQLDPNILLDVVKEDLTTFENEGIKRIAVPCNTFHYFYDEVQALTDIKIINMIDETIKYINSKGVQTIAVLGTRGTIQSGVFEKYAERYGINTINLNDDVMDMLMEMIYETKSTGRTSYPDFLELIENLRDNGAQMIVVACTELSLIEGLSQYEDVIVDSMDVLVRESILQLGYELKNPDNLLP